MRGALTDADSIEAGLTAFAAGDALGVPWEGKPTSEVDLNRVAEVPERPGWPQGAYSDDTVQMVATARHLVATDGNPDPARFISELASALPEMRGSGPTTRNAILRYQQTGQVGAIGGATNGAIMRILPAGWAIPASHAERRRDVVRRLTTVTHAAPSAVAAACSAAAMASYALEGCSRADLVTAAIEELRQSPVGVSDAVAQAADGRWHPGPLGASLDAMHTLAAIIHVLTTGPADTANAIMFAVALGGDTDTVAAITGGILGPIDPAAPIPWRDRVEIPGDLTALATGLAGLRQTGHG